MPGYRTVRVPFRAQDAPAELHEMVIADLEQLTAPPAESPIQRLAQAVAQVSVQAARQHFA